MDHLIAVRKTALEIASGLTAMNGISCPGCLLQQAENLTAFMLGQPYTVEHLPEPSVELEEPPQGPLN